MELPENHNGKFQMPHIYSPLMIFSCFSIHLELLSPPCLNMLSTGLQRKTNENSLQVYHLALCSFIREWESIFHKYTIFLLRRTIRVSLDSFPKETSMKSGYKTICSAKRLESVIDIYFLPEWLDRSTPQ